MATNNFKIVNMVLAADVANAAALTVAYPAGTAQADFTGVFAGDPADNIVIFGNSDRYVTPKVTFVYGAGNVQVTNATGATWKAGSAVTIQLGQQASSGTALGGIAPLAPAADLPTTVTKVNEIIAKT